MVIIKSRSIYSHFYWHLKIIYFYCLHLRQIAPITFILYSLQLDVEDRLEITVEFNVHCAKGMKDHLYRNYRLTLSSFSTSAALLCLQPFPCQPILHTLRNLTATQMFHILLRKSGHLSVKKINCVIKKVHHFLHLLQFYLSPQVSMHTHTHTDPAFPSICNSKSQEEFAACFFVLITVIFT